MGCVEGRDDADGTTEGKKEGDTDGHSDGTNDGTLDGMDDGQVLGTKLGESDGLDDGDGDGGSGLSSSCWATIASASWTTATASERPPQIPSTRQARSLPQTVRNSAPALSTADSMSLR